MKPKADKILKYKIKGYTLYCSDTQIAKSFFGTALLDFQQAYVNNQPFENLVLPKLAKIAGTGANYVMVPEKQRERVCYIMGTLGIDLDGVFEFLLSASWIRYDKDTATFEFFEEGLYNPKTDFRPMLLIWPHANDRWMTKVLENKIEVLEKGVVKVVETESLAFEEVSVDDLPTLSATELKIRTVFEELVADITNIRLGENSEVIETSDRESIMDQLKTHDSD